MLVSCPLAHSTAASRRDNAAHHAYAAAPPLKPSSTATPADSPATAPTDCHQCLLPPPPWPPAEASTCKASTRPLNPCCTCGAPQGTRGRCWDEARRTTAVSAALLTGPSVGACTAGKGGGAAGALHSPQKRTASNWVSAYHLQARARALLSTCPLEDCRGLGGAHANAHLTRLSSASGLLKSYSQRGKAAPMWSSCPPSNEMHAI